MPFCVRGEAFRRTACLCSCHFGSPSCDDRVCAVASTGTAVATPLVSTPRAQVVASSPRTTTHDRSFSRSIATPLGLTTRFTSPTS